jgi:chromosome segregation ATPase
LVLKETIRILLAVVARLARAHDYRDETQSPQHKFNHRKDDMEKTETTKTREDWPYPKATYEQMRKDWAAARKECQELRESYDELESKISEARKVLEGIEEGEWSIDSIFGAIDKALGFLK